ncbi:unnamed protein product [Caenorhabditis brenneri]
MIRGSNGFRPLTVPPTMEAYWGQPPPYEKAGQRIISFLDLDPPILQISAKMFHMKEMLHFKRPLGFLIFFISLFLIYTFFSNISEDLNSESLYNIPYPIITKSENPVKINPENIAIVIVLSEGLGRDYYKVALDSVECYAKAHGYQFILTNDSNWGCDYLKEKYFRRHCVVSKILPKFDAILHLDADIGVVNPEKKLEDYLDEKIDIIFYDRHFSPEIAIGSYLARNTAFSLEIIRDFAEYEVKLPNSFHGTENGALHMFLAEKLFPHNSIELDLCRRAWKNSQNVADQFTYTSCIRTIFGAVTDFGKLRILRKGTGHIRDGWLTSGIWNPERDFMIHGWKMNQLVETPKRKLEAVHMKQDIWYNPFLSDFHIGKCFLGNTTWNHDPKLIGTREDVEYGLRKHEMQIAVKKLKFLGRLFNLVKMSEMFHVKKKLPLLIISLVLFIFLYILFSGDDIIEESEYLYHIPYPIITKSENPVNITADKIAIVIVLAEGVKREFYKIAIDSVECYANAHGYQFILTTDGNWGCDYLNDKFFRRHCVIAKILPKYDAVLHLDADIGVVNPERKLEDFLDENFDIIFHDRHFSPEIGMASYFVRNTEYARRLIMEFSNYEQSLPVGSFHGTDNGAIHIFLADKLFPLNSQELDLCRRAWRNSQNIADQFAYTTCVRSVFGVSTDFGRVRILRKGTGYVRDDWLTSGIWSAERDFMLHGWKMDNLRKPVRSKTVKAKPMRQTMWYSPFLGDFDLEKCVLG